MYLKHKTWNVGDIKRQIGRISMECRSPYNEGFTAFDLKKELYELKFFIDQELKSCPDFAGEKEWLTELEKTHIIKFLKEE